MSCSQCRKQNDTRNAKKRPSGYLALREQTYTIKINEDKPKKRLAPDDVVKAINKVFHTSGMPKAASVVSPTHWEAAVEHLDKKQLSLPEEIESDVIIITTFTEAGVKAKLVPLIGDAASLTKSISEAVGFNISVTPKNKKRSLAAAEQSADAKRNFTRKLAGFIICIMLLFGGFAFGAMNDIGALIAGACAGIVYLSCDFDSKLFFARATGGSLIYHIFVGDHSFGSVEERAKAASWYWKTGLAHDVALVCLIIWGLIACGVDIAYMAQYVTFDTTGGSTDIW